MSDMVQFKSIIFVFFICFSFVCSGQNGNQDSTIVSNNYDSYQGMSRKILLTELPPLDTLFANARIRNARLLSQEMEIEVAAREKITQRRMWMSFVRGMGTYQYGLMASLVDITQGGVPINPQYSRSAQNWWNVGVGLNIPLNELIDIGNRVKKEDAKIKLAQYDLEVKFDELKIEIAEAYSSAILSLTLSKALSDRYNYMKTQYEVFERDFVIGKVTSLELTTAKGQEVTAYVELQKELSNLIRYTTILETLSKTPILNY